MGKNVDEIVVGGNGSIFTAVLGSTIPASIADPLGVAWREAGYVTNNGVKFTDSRTLAPIDAWQSLYALRQIVTAKDAMAVFELMQWSAGNVIFAFGGGSIETIAAPVVGPPAVPGEYRYHPPTPEEVDELMLAVEWVDGVKDYRLVFPKGMVSQPVATDVTRTAAALLPITFSLLGVDGEDPWILDTNDPAFADA